MKKIALKPDNMGKQIKEIIEKKQNDFFIFPTDVVMNSWIDWIVLNTNVSAVTLERFKAWDNFKSEYVSAHEQGKTAIPSVLRKMFVTDLISKNSNKNTSEEEKFHLVLSDDEKFSKEAVSFADWLCNIIKSLHFWKTRLIENVPKEKWDDEDLEYLKLYDCYNNFLQKNDLFEPSWVDDVEFSGKGRNFHIFYPELLEDFIDYKDILAKADNIFFYVLPHEKSQEPEVYLYSDSRKELRQTMLNISHIVNNGGGDWSDFALSVPNIELYRPYLQREFELYSIPYVIKAGVSFTKNSAGRIFREIKDCYDTNFSYDSLRTLLLDECVPWQEQVVKEKERLIREGYNMRCICSVGKDVWIQGFEKRIKELQGENFAEEKAELEDILNFYKELKSYISPFFPEELENSTFANIRISWMNFKNHFLKPTSEFSQDANDILSRCIVELNEIIEVESAFKENGLKISNPFDFFLQEIDKKTYTKQTSKTGVNIFPYKLSAAANFKYQFVIDCSQKNLDVSHKRLVYLTNEKREMLKLTDDDNFITLGQNDDDKNSSSNKLRPASEVFIELYRKGNNEEKIVHFSAAKDSFNGFAIPHNYFTILADNLPNFDKEDYILKERNIILSASSSVPDCTGQFFQSQIDSYKNWVKTSIENDSDKYIVNTKLKNAINKNLITNHKKYADDNKIKITARSCLEKFFPCPRKWIFKSILHLSDDSLDTNLMKNYDMGNLNHNILEKFMNTFKNSKLPFYDVDEEIFKKIEDESSYPINTPSKDYTQNINDLFYNSGNIVEQAIFETSEFRESPLVVETLLSQKKKIADNIVSFLKTLLKPYVQGEFVDPSKSYKDFNGIGNCTVCNVEKTLVKNMEDFDYLGKLDCYLLSPNNQWIIIDYKNSKIPKEGDFYADKDDILGNFQMAVYHKIVSAQKENHEICASYFYGVKKSDKSKVTDSNAKKSGFDNEENTERVLDDYAEIFVDAVKNNSFEPHNSLDKKDKLRVVSYLHCNKCAYKTICRTTYNIAGKELPQK